MIDFEKLIELMTNMPREELVKLGEKLENFKDGLEKEFGKVKLDQESFKTAVQQPTYKTTSDEGFIKSLNSEAVKIACDMLEQTGRFWKEWDKKYVVNSPQRHDYTAFACSEIMRASGHHMIQLSNCKHEAYYMLEASKETLEKMLKVLEEEFPGIRTGSCNDHN